MRRAPTARLAVLIVALAAVGCRSTPGTYLRSRVGDVLDVVPVSLAYGRGIGASVRATPLFHVGLNLWPIRSSRWGYDDRAVRGIWREYETGVPWTLFSDDFVEKLPVSVAQLPPLPRDVADDVWSAGLPIVYRWQSARDAVQGEDIHSRGRMPDVLHLGRHPSYVRETTGAFLVPEVRRRVHFREWRRTTDALPVMRAGSAEVASGWTAVRGLDRMPPDWGRFEFDLFLGLFGARLGVRPLEFVDLAVGLFDVDLLGDDLPNPVTFVPTSPVGGGADVEALQPVDAAPPETAGEPESTPGEQDAAPAPTGDEDAPGPADDEPEPDA